MKKKVIIIGAGPAGLSTAYELSKNKDFDITILELEKFVGGISRTAYYNGNRMDVGGHRFFDELTDHARVFIGDIGSFLRRRRSNSNIQHAGIAGVGYAQHAFDL